MSTDEKPKQIPLKYLVISVLVVFLGFLASRQPSENRVSPTGEYYVSSDVQIQEIFLCEGLGENRYPINRLEKGDSEDWKKIHVCAYVTTTEPSTLIADWYFEERAEPFAWGDVSENAYHDGYVVFSLEESVRLTKELPWQRNYLGDEISANYLPEGEYQVKIYQARKLIVNFSFAVK